MGSNWIRDLMRGVSVCCSVGVAVVGYMCIAIFSCDPLDFFQLVTGSRLLPAALHSRRASKLDSEIPGSNKGPYGLQ